MVKGRRRAAASGVATESTWYAIDYRMFCKSPKFLKDADRQKQRGVVIGRTKKTFDCETRNPLHCGGIVF
jgi:hypothetical protein